MLPFLKWAGGKRWLVHNGELIAPAGFERLIEPFLGGAAVFFALEPKRALLGDLNPELIELYEVVREEPGRLQTILSWHQEKHSRLHYYAIRNRSYRDKAWRAARTLYLNRTCWNGLYRLNRKGDFNVPIGTKTAILLEESFSEIAKLLDQAVLVCQDFEATVKEAKEGDFLFVDPPYTVRHNMNGFLKYNEKIFSWEDQERLCRSLIKAADRGAAIVLTNADHSSIRELYESRFNYKPLQRHSVLSGKSHGRGLTTEALFTINL
jgi:DNA adenine methylase